MTTDEINLAWLNAWNAPRSYMDIQSEIYCRLRSAGPCVVKFNVSCGKYTFDLAIFSENGDALAVVEIRKRKVVNTMLMGVPVFICSDPETMEKNCQTAEYFIKEVLGDPQNDHFSFTHVEAHDASDVCVPAGAPVPSHMIACVGSYNYSKAIVTQPHTTDHKLAEPTAAISENGESENQIILVNQKLPDTAPSNPEFSLLTDLAGTSQSLGGAEIQRVMDVWNGVMVLPRILSLRGREKSVRRALQDPFFRDNWREGIKRIAASRFCKGNNRQGEAKKPWKATFDWFLLPKVLPRVLEGLYDDRISPILVDEDRKYDQDTI